VSLRLRLTLVAAVVVAATHLAVALLNAAVMVPT